MKLAAHPAAEGLENHLVLLDSATASKAFADYGGGVVVAVACEILDRYAGRRAGLS